MPLLEYEMPIAATQKELDKAAKKDAKNGNTDATDFLRNSRGNRPLTDAEIENLTKEQLEEIINSKMGSATEREKYADHYLETFYGGKTDRGARALLASQLVQDGTEALGFKVADKLMSNTGRCDEVYLSLLMNLIQNKDVSETDDTLFKSEFYSQSEEENLYKIKAYAFLTKNGGANIRSYKLYKDDGSPIKPQDIIPMSSPDIRAFLENNAHGDGLGDTIRERAEKENYTSRNVFTFVERFVKSIFSDATKQTEIITKVRELKDNPKLTRQWNEFLDLELVDGREATQIEDFIGTLNKRSKGTVKTYLDQEALSLDSLLPKMRDTIKSLFGAEASEVLSSYSELLKDNSLRTKLEQQPVSEVSLEGVAKAIKQFLDGVSASREASADYTIQDYLKKEHINALGLANKFLRRLSEVYTSKTLTRRRELFRSVLSNDALTKKLVQQRVTGLADDLVLQGIKEYLDNLSLVVRRANRRKKAEHDAKLDSEVEKLINDAADVLMGLELPRGEARALVMNAYKPGLTLEQLVAAALRGHNV